MVDRLLLGFQDGVPTFKVSLPGYDVKSVTARYLSFDGSRRMSTIYQTGLLYLGGSGQPTSQVVYFDDRGFVPQVFGWAMDQSIAAGDRAVHCPFDWSSVSPLESNSLGRQAVPITGATTSSVTITTTGGIFGGTNALIINYYIIGWA